MNKDSKIFVTGHKGLVGSALIRELQLRGYYNLFTTPRCEVDLTNSIETQWYFSCVRPEYVFHCAARVGGIKANVENRLSFFLENSIMQQNVFRYAAQYGVKRLLFLGSSCIYPSDAPKPLKEEYLLTGPFEPAVEAYGLAKVCGVKLCQYYRQDRGCDFLAALPCNIFGKGERLDEQHAHLVTGLFLRMHRAKLENSPTFKVWGDGSARRELLFSEDLARALITIMADYTGAGPINAGSGLELSIAEIAQMVRAVVAYEGALVSESSEPTGAVHKRMDNTKLFNLGWSPQVGIMEALKLTYEDICDRLAKQ